MIDLITIFSASIILVVGILVVLKLTSDKTLRHSEEYRIGLIGSMIFMFVSWITIYIANIHPFVKPEFKKEKSPDYFKN